jgi:serine hydrolase
MKAILIPGNGCSGDLSDCIWYPWLARELRALHVPIALRGFPDPLYAREHIWKAFVVHELGLDHETIMIGHSSGAACALRLMEEHATAGCVLVAAYDNDLGIQLERDSGYFSRPFDYARMRQHTPWIVQFHSQSDQVVPVAVGRQVAARLQSTYIESADDGHFLADRYPAMLEAVRSRLDP